jgi:serine/threonine-protein kinase HipA
MAKLELDVFLESSQTPIGRLSRHDEGRMSFHYLNGAPTHAISLSLPHREAPYGDMQARSFFANLLFENAQREQIMQRHGVDFSDVVGLLYHLGADCPGAISCVPLGTGPAKQPGNLDTDYDALDDKRLTQLMTSLRDHRRVPDETADPSPLAGVQGKVAVTRLPDGTLALPKRGLNVPTTHILKVPRAAQMRSVEDEHRLMKLMAKLQGHPVADTTILGDGELRGLLITRFDRQVDGTLVRRLHQEDFCQALGLGPHLKYQRNGIKPRAFSAQAIGQLLEQLDDPGRSRQAFLEITLANLLLGNTDNHAKNHALLYLHDRPTLAPVYDVVPTLIDNQVTHELSFEIGSANMTDEITPADIQSFVTDLCYPRSTPALRKRMQTMVRDAISHISEEAGPARKAIDDAIAEQATRLASALELQVQIPERDMVVINRP